MASVVGIDHCTQTTKYPEHRRAISWHIWEHSVENPASPALSCWEYDRFKGFNGFIGFKDLQWLQWPSTVSKRFKGFKGFKEVQRPSKVQRCRLRLRWSVKGEEPRLNNDKNGEIDRGVAEMQHLLLWCCRCATPWCDVVLQHVGQRHSKTQYLVAKKTNNFNGLTQKNRLHALDIVVGWLDVVAR